MRTCRRRSSRERNWRLTEPLRPRLAPRPRLNWFARRTSWRDARKAIDHEDCTSARRLADQAEAEATLAETRAQAAVENENLQQMQGTMGDLRQIAVPPPTELVPK